uniref:Exonuclease domain-containing protein n=2 Tax=Oryza TaxID=4527 RepID=A0A0E0E1N1_9ORYZ
MALARVSPPAFSSPFLIHSLLRPFSSPSSVLRPRVTRVPHHRGFAIAAALSQASPLPSADGDGAVMEAPPRPSSRRPWKPTCLYYTQGKCTMVGFSFPFSRFTVVWLMWVGYRINRLDSGSGKVEILEFPVVMIDAQSMEFVDSFHRFVHPTAMSEQRIREYIEGKYGKFGVDRVWHDTAIPFMEVLQEFEDWIEHHKFWKKEQGGALNSAAFITWFRILVEQELWKILEATGMMTMMRELQMPIVGSHHLGIDDAKNIARVVQRMLADGAVMQITAKRQSATGDVKFLFKNRIR